MRELDKQSEEVADIHNELEIMKSLLEASGGVRKARHRLAVSNKVRSAAWWYMVFSTGVLFSAIFSMAFAPYAPPKMVALAELNFVWIYLNKALSLVTFIAAHVFSIKAKGGTTSSSIKPYLTNVVIDHIYNQFVTEADDSARKVELVDFLIAIRNLNDKGSLGGGDVSENDHIPELDDYVFIPTFNNWPERRILILEDRLRIIQTKNAIITMNEKIQATFHKGCINESNN